MRRRKFLTLAGSAAAWPLAAYGQQPERLRRIAMVFGVADDAQGQARLDAFKKGMEALGWFDGQNIQFDVRFTGNADNVSGISTYHPRAVKQSRFSCTRGHRPCRA